MTQVYIPPNYPSLREDVSIFLAGSIEMGKAKDWQKEFIDTFSNHIKDYNITNVNFAICNPRRPDWDSTWVQSEQNPYFFQQVDWELRYLERCLYKIFFFAENTISPISLLELGKFANSNDSFVIVEDNYQRKGNVDIFCKRYNIPITTIELASLQIIKKSL